MLLMRKKFDELLYDFNALRSGRITSLWDHFIHNRKGNPIINNSNNQNTDIRGIKLPIGPVNRKAIRRLMWEQCKYQAGN